MAKRFTESDKWKENVFRKKDIKSKLFWFYIFDNCDYAGIWQVDFELASFMIGVDLEEDLIIAEIKHDIVVFQDGEKWFIPEFIRVQYGKQLSKRNQVHTRVIKTLFNAELEDDLLDAGVEIVQEIDTATAIRARITNKYRLSLYTRDEFTCQYCSKQFTRDELTLDHIIPVSKGGKNTDENLVTACNCCNGRKGDKDLEVFLSQNKNLSPTTKVTNKIGMKVLDMGMRENSLSAPKEEEEAKVKFEVEKEDKAKAKENLKVKLEVIEETMTKNKDNDKPKIKDRFNISKRACKKNKKRRRR